MKFQSTKLFEGFTTCFRQHRAKGTLCESLHGYFIQFKITFEGDLDERNWVWDFGGMKRSKTKIDGLMPSEWMNYMFDHTVILAEDDPELPLYKQLTSIRLRTLRHVGAERFAEFIFNKINTFVFEETEGRVKVAQVEFFENPKNSAIVS